MECFKVPPPDWRSAGPTTKSPHLLGAAIANQGKYAEAEPALIDGYRGLAARAQLIPAIVRTVYLREAAGRLVFLYEQWNKPREAAEWRQVHESL